MKPARPNHAHTPPSHAVGAARTTRSSGTTPTQASHHHEGAGKASASIAPTANASARPGARRARPVGGDRRHHRPPIAGDSFTGRSLLPTRAAWDTFER